MADVGVPNTGVTNVGDVLSTTSPVPVDVVVPVPPFVTPNTPLITIAPVVGELGFNPVVPPLNDVTPAGDGGEPFAADVIRPSESTVIVGYVYVPEDTPVVDNDNVGFPPSASPFATSICPPVPVMVTGDIVEPVFKASNPEPAELASASGSPERLIVGLPDTPVPLEIAIPEPLTAILLGVKVLAPVLTTKPVASELSCAVAPFKLIVYAPCAPPSVIVKLASVEKYRLFGKFGVRVVVRKV